MIKIALWIRVGLDDWKAERAIIASNAVLKKQILSVGVNRPLLECLRGSSSTVEMIYSSSRRLTIKLPPLSSRADLVQLAFSW